MIIKELPDTIRPRERLIKAGAESLSDSELIAILLRNGSKRENALNLANRLLSSYKLDALAEASVKELTQIKGIGIAKACTLKAAAELMNRIKQNTLSTTRIRSALDAFNYASPLLNHKKQEHFMVIFLNTRNIILKHEIVFIGTLNEAIIHPREIFKKAIAESASSIIIVHNHPSGNTSPSEEDIKITKKLIRSGEILGIEILDHIIIGTGYWSYREHHQKI